MSATDDENVIRLDQFLKLQGAVGTGGQAKMIVQSGEVAVNGQVETRRGRKLVPGDVVTVGDLEWIVETD
jgi:ribosome-associated protein